MRILLAPALLALALVAATAAHAGASGAVESSTGCVRATAAVGASAPHRAALVVTFGDRHTKSFCIEFAEDSITGVQLLQRSGLPLVTSGSGGLGAAVCSIDGEGSSDPTNCFASCTGGSCAYWAYYRFVDGKWAFSQAGGSQTAVHDGDVQGWAWGPGGVSAGAVPEVPGTICPAPTAMPTNTTVPPPPTATKPPPQATIVRPPTIAPEASPAATEKTLPTNEPAAGTPAAGAPSQPPAAGSPAPAPARQGAVEGVSKLHEQGTPTPRAAPGTPRSGAIVVGKDDANRNEANSESRGTGGGGSRASIIAFAIIAAVLAAVGGIVWYRRRRAY